MTECIYNEPFYGFVRCKLQNKLTDEKECETCKDKVKPKVDKVKPDRSDCIHRYEKSIGDESFSFCGEPMEDRCVEGDICDYCDAYESEEDNGKSI